MIEKLNNQRKVKMKGYGTNYAVNMTYPGHIRSSTTPGQKQATSIIVKFG